MVDIKQINSHCRLALLWMNEFVKENPSSSRRETEKKGTLFLLKQLYPSAEPELCYYENGKPYLKGHKGGISISHSHDLLAVLADEKNEHTGLDVEQIRDKVLKIRHKFLSEKEKVFIAEGNVPMHITAWCAKETMFKIYAEGNVDFIEHLHIEKFEEKDEKLFITCTVNENVLSKQLRIIRLDNYIISYPEN